jgi:putative Holliday junction resolvase
MRLLALDVGERRIGVAACDETGLIASPLQVIRRTSKVDDFRKIARLVRDQEVEGLVVGYPLNDDGSAGPQARSVERYVAALRSALEDHELTLEVVLWDEYMSTQRAQTVLIETGRKVAKRRDWIDAVAAAVILQDYLDEQRGALRP